jgi:hypothetical protein
MFQFKLKFLLFSVALIAGLAALSTQVGMSSSEFRFIENQLTLNDEGLVNGKIRWSFSDHLVNGEKVRGREFVCTVTNLKLSPDVYQQLLLCKPGSRRTIKYRSRAIGPLAKQDPFKHYISSELGIDGEKITGYAWFDGWTQVVIDGP